MASLALGMRKVGTVTADLAAFHAEHVGSRVSVLYGPQSREDALYIEAAEPAQLSITAITESLSRLGFEWEVVNPLASDLALQLSGSNFVFVNMHGEWGEDGRLQGFLDYLGLPYTGSGVIGSATSLNKVIFKRLARDLGIRTPLFWEWTAGTVPVDADLPLIVKPVSGGSSIGLRLLRTPGDLQTAWDAEDRSWPSFAEEFIPGRCLTVGVLERRRNRLELLPPVEVRPPGDLYDEDAKLDEDAVHYTCPASVTPGVRKTYELAVQTMCRVAEIRGLARFDFVLNESEDVYMLEANTIPGLSRHSNFATAAEAAGLAYDDLILALLRSSLWKT